MSTMRTRSLTKSAVTLAVLLTVPMSSLMSQELPKSDGSFEVEPPLLIPPGDMEGDAEERPDAAKLEQQLERAKKSAASAERLVKTGVLAKVEAEQRELRVVRLEAELANAQLVAAQEQVTSQQARHASKAELDAALATLAQASAKAQAADKSYDKAQLEAAELNLRRQRQLLAQGSARKSDVARAEERLATLQGSEQTPR